ncbi:uncharacterized protein K441DRAFT_686866 [Cenococcum geophilum 1.58]|uniref:uncharacterized protein n=1 Tax=Cenococcum geophilum 1.58 TaxID=794803 RepID=UPI00358E8A22|nr:hypothetical protein K441DRAFT_686866 [Cenococcum geophilum 1.58]
MPPIPPIPIHSNDPITPNAPSDTTAAKPAGITPQTANPLPTRTTPASIPATTTTDPSAPPAPQPGARPSPPTAIAAPTGTRDDSTPAPPAPAPAPGARPSTVTATHTTMETRALPAQLSIPPPVGSAAPGRSTTPSLCETGAAHSVAHPPGYAQDPYAADGSAAVRRSLEDAAVREHEEGAQGGLWGLLGRAGEALRKGEEGVWRAVGGKGR